MNAQVIPLPLSISNAYLLIGDRPVLVDAGAPGDGKRLVALLREHGVAPDDLALIAFTHGHTDHTGAVAVVARGGVPVAVGAADAGLLQAGANGKLPPTGPAGTLLRPMIKRMTFPGWTPQIRVTEALRLDPYGIGAVMVPVGAHTPGSCAILIDGGDAIVGDLIRAASPAAGSGPATRCGTISPRTPARPAVRSNESSPTSRPRYWSVTADPSPRPTSATGSTRSHRTAVTEHDRNQPSLPAPHRG